jgi:aromatase
VQDFSMKPEAPVDDEQAEQNMNKSTREQMRVVKERLEAKAAEAGV